MSQHPWETAKAKDAQRVEVSAKDYYEAYPQYMSSHKLETFRKSPALFKHEYIDGKQEREHNPAFTFGSACHAYILEGMSAFKEGYLVAKGPINDKTGQPYGSNTKKFAEWLETHAGGRELITEQEYERMIAMGSGVYTHEKAKELLATGQAEVTIRANMSGINCQSRLDWICDKQRVIVDLKTIDSLPRFEKQFDIFGYQRQMAFYRSMARAVTGEDYSVYMVVTEKTAPHRCGVWYVSPTTLHVAEDDIQTNLYTFGQCNVNDQWPTRYEEVRAL